MPEIYCHGKTLRNALRAVWLEAGKTLFGQVATGAQDAGGVDAGPRRPATMTAPSAGSHGLLGGADAARRKSQGF